MTDARSTVPSAVWIRWSVVPDTTWALVRISSLPMGNPRPVTSPPQPVLTTLTVTAAACATPGVFTDVGIGSAPGRVGCRPAKAGGHGRRGGDHSRLAR